MEIIIESNCENIEEIKPIYDDIKKFVLDIVSFYNIESIKYFVIAPIEPNAFATTVYKYAKLIDDETRVNNDESYHVSGKALSAVGEDGTLQQIVIIKSGLISSLYIDLYVASGGQLNEQNVKGLEAYNRVKNIGLMIILHEIGHVIDNHTRFKITGKENKKIEYDLDYEYDEYIFNQVLCLWGEYYAESLPHKLYGALDGGLNKKEMLIECIKNYSKEKEIGQIIERAHRIVYLYMHLLAYYHTMNLEVSFYSEYKGDKDIEKYIPYLTKIELAILELSLKYPNWDMDKDLDNLVGAYKNLMDFERIVTNI